MKLFVNGQEVEADFSGKIDIQVVLDGDEEVGPITVDLKGGCLFVRSDEDAAVTLTGSPGITPFLVLGRGLGG